MSEHKCPECGGLVEVEMSEWGFYMVAYCAECDDDYDPRLFLSEDAQRSCGELGIMVAHPKYIDGTSQNERYKRGEYVGKLRSPRKDDQP